MTEETCLAATNSFPLQFTLTHETSISHSWRKETEDLFHLFVQQHLHLKLNQRAALLMELKVNFFDKAITQWPLMEGVIGG